MPPSRPYTVTGNRKIAYPQSRVMRNSFPGNQEAVIKTLKQILIIIFSQKRTEVARCCSDRERMWWCLVPRPRGATWWSRGTITPSTCRITTWSSGARASPLSPSPCVKMISPSHLSRVSSPLTLNAIHQYYASDPNIDILYILCFRKSNYPMFTCFPKLFI